MAIEQWVHADVLFLRPTQDRLAGDSGSTLMQVSFRQAFEAGHLAIAVDLENVQYMDLAVVRTFIAEFKFLNRYDGLVCVLNVKRELHEFLAQTILGKVIDICHNEHDALILFQGRQKRRRTAGGVGHGLSKVYSWGFRAGLLPDRRGLGSRRDVSERREAMDRRARAQLGEPA